MKYILYNIETRKRICFDSSKELHEWIKANYRLMSYDQMSSYVVSRSSVYDIRSSDGIVFQAELSSHVAELPDYILSHLH